VLSITVIFTDQGILLMGEEFINFHMNNYL